MLLIYPTTLLACLNGIDPMRECSKKTPDSNKLMRKGVVSTSECPD